MIHLAVDEMYKRFFEIEHNSDIDSDLSDSELNTSFKEQLEKAISNSKVNSKKKAIPSNVLKKEFGVYEITGKITTNLKDLYDALLTIKKNNLRRK